MREVFHLRIHFANGSQGRPGATAAWNSIHLYSSGGRGIWAILCSLSRHANRELDQKQEGLQLALLQGAGKASGGLTWFATRSVPSSALTREYKHIEKNVNVVVSKRTEIQLSLFNVNYVYILFPKLTAVHQALKSVKLC